MQGEPPGLVDKPLRLLQAKDWSPPRQAQPPDCAEGRARDHRIEFVRPLGFARILHVGWWGATRTTRFEIGGCNRQLLCIPPLRARMPGLPVAHLQEGLVFPANPLTLHERLGHPANPLTLQQRLVYLATPLTDGQRGCH